MEEEKCCDSPSKAMRETEIPPPPPPPEYLPDAANSMHFACHQC